MARVGPSLLSVALLLPAASGQVEWQKAATLDARQGHAMAYDVARQRTVLFGGIAGAALGDTWEWDGGAWRIREVAMAPEPRQGHAMAYDVRRGRAVLFGGSAPTGALRDTWEWDGDTWTLRTPPVSPPAFSSVAMAYDVGRARTVLFGATGTVFGGGVGETWEWDGSTWTQRNPVTVPAMRIGTAMAYDLARGKVVMFGGFDGQFASPPFADTWEWDGVDWTSRSPTTSPPGRTYHGLAYDVARGRVVLTGGRDTGMLSLPRTDTWEWDGSDWVERFPATRQPGLASHAMAYDVARSRVVAWGGWLATTETWAWDGIDWARVTPQMSPALRRVAAATFDADRERTVLLGVDVRVITLPWRTVTWEWDGAHWALRTPPVSPPGRSKHALAYDSVRKNVLLFGGLDGTRNLGDTWLWDGTTWQPQVGSGPPIRAEHHMAFDSHRGVVVLFGGRPSPDPVPPFADTWEWDGRVWTQRFPATIPLARFEHAMAYDAARGQVVLFGGLAGVIGPTLGDTWLWDGVDWTWATPATSPPARQYHDMAYDAARERVVLFGGSAFPFVPRDTWEWDGVDWRVRATPIVPPPRGWNTMSYDAAREQVVSFGGENFADTWLYSNRSQARYTSFGTGCAGTVGTPELAAVGGRRPWVGEVFDVELRNLVPGGAVFLIFGCSNRAWGSVPLPLSLGFLGMPGCELRVSVEAADALPNVAGVAASRIRIPNQPALIGARYFQQGFAFDPGANALGAVVSNAAEGVIGAR